MVLNRHQPEALLVHLDKDSLLSEPGIRLALATALYREHSLSLGQAARFLGVSPAEFIRHVSRFGIPVIRGTAATVQEGQGDNRRMAERLVAADASPLIGLAAAGAFDLLRSLFVRITVTEAEGSGMKMGQREP